MSWIKTHKIWTGIILVVAIGLAASIIAGGSSRSQSAAPAYVEQSAEPSTTAASQPGQTHQPAETAAPVDNSDSTANKVVFVSSATKNLSDLNKDLDDMVTRASNQQMIRLSANQVEVEFNLAQLVVLTPPSSVAQSWSQGILGLNASVDSLAQTTSAYVDGTIDLATMLAAIEDVRSQATLLAAVVAQVV
ncbi:MAG: hypothetical protein ACOYBP_01515 [Microbacteriaceae bacterium]